MTTTIKFKERIIAQAEPNKPTSLDLRKFTELAIAAQMAQASILFATDFTDRQPPTAKVVVLGTGDRANNVISQIALTPDIPKQYLTLGTAMLLCEMTSAKKIEPEGAEVLVER